MPTYLPRSIGTLPRCRPETRLSDREHQEHSYGIGVSHQEALPRMTSLNEHLSMYPYSQKKPTISHGSSLAYRVGHDDVRTLGFRSNMSDDNRTLSGLFPKRGIPKTNVLELYRPERVVGQLDRPTIVFLLQRWRKG